jgi:hypothetical protein
MDGRRIYLRWVEGMEVRGPMASLWPHCQEKRRMGWNKYVLDFARDTSGCRKTTIKWLVEKATE